MQILIVVVRYKIPLHESATLLSLTAIFAASPRLLESCSVLLWDNSPTALEKPELAFPFRYVHSERNRGVSGAYNGALEQAEAAACPWLLLLDQDTTLPAGYLERMLGYSRELEAEKHVATVVPFVQSNNTLVSPRRFGRWVRNHQIDRSVTGLYREDAYAVNSATLMRTESLREVGGYSEVFWLDLSDAYIFHTLHLHGKWMYIAGDLEVPHSIATLDFNANMSVARYRSFLAAESLYAEQFRPWAANVVHTVWLLARALRQWHRYTNKEFARSTLEFFWQRLLWTRRAKQRRWKRELTMREMPAIANGQVIG